MAEAREPSSVAPADVGFELDRFEDSDGRLIVEGRWFGVRGRRFIRPTLTFGGHSRLLADLVDKPWTAEDGRSWRASFALDEQLDGELPEAELAVGPDLAVTLSPPQRGKANRDRRRRSERVSAGRSAKQPSSPSAERPETELARVRSDRERLRLEHRQLATDRKALQGELEVAAAETDRLRARLRHTEQELADVRVAHERLQANLERTHAALDSAREDLARAGAQANNATAARDAAMVQRDSAVAEHEGASRALDQARRELAAALAERDAAVAERDALVTERDAAVAERDAAVTERDALVAERDPAAGQRPIPAAGARDAWLAGPPREFDFAPAPPAAEPAPALGADQFPGLMGPGVTATLPATQRDTGWLRRATALAVLLVVLLALLLVVKPF